MPTQVQIRGTTQATQESRTLASRELDINTTDDRLCVHDGSTAGGIPHINFNDHINQEYTYAAASGTDTITMSLAIAPAAYAAGQQFVFKAAATNTGSATLNVNSLGAKTIKKKDVGAGTLSTLSAGDIISGGVYRVYYDGTDLILEAVDGGGITSVSQGDLNTSTGTFSDSTSSTYNVAFSSNDLTLNPDYAHVTLPSGQYGFTLQSNVNSAGRSGGWWLCNDSTSYVTGAMPFVYYNAGATITVGGQQRYVTASPPYDLGDGEIAGFIFLKLDKTGKVVGHYAADTPPWAYNGPTDICAREICPLSGKKYRYTTKKLTIEEIIAGKKPRIIKEEITDKIKNKDMNLIPHPFRGADKEHRIIAVDLLSDKVRNLIEYQNAGGGADITDFITSNKFVIDNEALDLKSPKGVSVHKMKL